MLTVSTPHDRSDRQEQPISMTGLSFAVVDKYKDLVYRTALTVTRCHEDAEDILQEVFFRYFRSHPVFETEEHEKAWLLRVTINAGKNLLRSAWIRRRSDADVTELAETPQHPENSEVLQAVLSLPEKYRIAIYLHYYEGYSVAEIAALTGRSAAAVGQHLSRGRAKLRKLLGGDGA
ncbi:MAG: sigma-70 family RNA polymerase sigma factor [Oscillospiraceae bacterium]|nr:sigma-70 family RNA polymerase sigma factor [Oscillospiraceae bacterium]